MAGRINTIDIDILNDYWLGGLGEMDYTFEDGSSETRGPNVYVTNSGKFRRGIVDDPDTPNPFGCPSARLGNMAADVNLSSSFGDGARIYTTTEIIDAVVCPLLDITNGDIVVGAYGFDIKIKQQGDRQN